MSWIVQHFETYESYIPIDLLSIKGFVLANLVISTFLIVRYFGFVVPFYIPFWKNKSRGESLHARPVKEDQISFEIRWSMISTLIFAFSGYVIGVLWQLGWTQIYLPFDHFSLWYLPISFIIYSLIHEVYFYLTHLLMHKPLFYKKIHAIHHYSVSTTPWASFSFHPFEAIVHAIFIPILILVIPIHPVVIIFYLTFMTLTAISNHLGFEILKPQFLQKYFISGTHHSLHHSRFNGNYGLYFTFIDKVFNTEID